MNNHSPAISVLMPAYNESRFIEEAITSILSQTFYDFELIVVDDGSTDSTPEILSRLAKTDSRISLYRNDQRQGIAKSLNSISRIAQAALLARMDADDWADEERFEIQIEAFKQDPSLALCGSNVTHTDEAMRQLFRTALPVLDWEIRCAALFENPFAHPSIMMRTDVFQSVGGYNEGYRTSQDYDLWTRLLFQGAVCNVQQSLVMARRHNMSVSARFEHLQFQNTGIIQRDYARRWLGLTGWNQSQYETIRRHIYRGSRPLMKSGKSGADAISYAVALTITVEKCFPEKKNTWLRRYIFGRCVFSALRWPLNYATIARASCLLVQNPGTCLRGFIQLTKTSFRMYLLNNS